MPLPKDSPFDIRLSSGRESKPYGLILDRGSLSVSAVAQDDSVYIRNVGKKTGDFDEQRSWKGGRGHEKFNDNAEGYWDGTAWTMTKGHVHNALLWRYAKGLRKATSNFSNSKSWRALVGASLGISVSFTPEETGSYTSIALWLRWRGSSVATNTLTINLHSNSSGSPGTVLQTTTKTVADVGGTEASALLLCNIGAESLTAGTTYHISVSGASDSSTASHWEVAVDASGTASKISSDLAAWSAPSPTFSMLYRIVDTVTPRNYYPFFLDNHFYVVSYYSDAATASKVFINGDRGKATAGASTTLTDTGSGVRSVAWATNMWAGASIRIVRGTGKGQKRQIASNTGTVITVSVAFDTTPDTTSEYLIYSTPQFQELVTTGLGVVTGEPVVFNNIVYFPQGATAIREMALDYTAATNHKYRSEATNTADFLLSSYSRAANAAVIWRAVNSTVAVSSAPVVAYGTDLVFGTAITCGDKSYPITGLNEKEDGALWVFKENGPGQVANNSYTALKTGQEDTPDDSNGRASLAVDRFTYYSWLHTLVRVYGSSHDDIGQDFSGKGLPAQREGVFYYLDAYISTVLCAIDAGAGQSSVLAWDGLSWHEIFRNPFAGYRCRMVKVQPCPETRNMIWISAGAGDMVYLETPLNKKDPLLDSGALYMHESILHSAVIDMGAASDLPKMIKSLTATVNNLNAEGKEVYLDYKVDENCANNTFSPWIRATTMTQSPESTAFLGLQNVRRFQYRLRMNTDNALIPVDIEGIVPSGYARTPLKLMWTMRVKAGGVYQVGSQTNPNSTKLWKWLMDNARFPYSVYMESKYDAADGYHVIVHPPRMTPYKPAEPGSPEESFMTLTLEEI